MCKTSIFEANERLWEADKSKQYIVFGMELKGLKKNMAEWVRR